MWVFWTSNKFLAFTKAFSDGLKNNLLWGIFYVA